MTSVSARELHDRTDVVLRRVAGGESLTVTVDGRPVAEMRPLPSGRRAAFTRADLTDLLRHQTDPGLRVELDVLAFETTDVLDRP